MEEKELCHEKNTHNKNRDPVSHCESLCVFVNPVNHPTPYLPNCVAPHAAAMRVAVTRPCIKEARLKVAATKNTGNKQKKG
jgi:hypothetical protein